MNRCDSSTGIAQMAVAVAHFLALCPRAALQPLAASRSTPAPSLQLTVTRSLMWGGHPTDPARTWSSKRPQFSTGARATIKQQPDSTHQLMPVSADAFSMAAPHRSFVALDQLCNPVLSCLKLLLQTELGCLQLLLHTVLSCFNRLCCIA